jgi:hypothetical protein
MRYFTSPGQGAELTKIPGRHHYAYLVAYERLLGRYYIQM